MYSFELLQPLNTHAEKEEFRTKIKADLSNIDLGAISWKNDLERPDKLSCTLNTDMYCEEMRDQHPANSMSVEYYNYGGANRDLKVQIIRIVQQHVPGAKCTSYPVMH